MALYGLALLKLFYYSVYYNLFFGEQSIVYSQPVSHKNFKDLAYLLYGSSSPVMPAIFISVVLVCSLYTLGFKKFSFLPDLVIWFGMLNLQNKVYPTLTGGDFLLTQFLFLNCFLTFRSDQSRYLVTTRRLLHNLACVALLIQIALVYLFSGLAKLADKEWVDGTALTTIAQVDYFSLHAAFRESVWTPIFRIMTWFVLVYQLLFPLLMWLPRIKKPLLIAGIIMHVYIALVLGLLQFGLVMIAAYAFLWPLSHHNRLK